MKWLITYVFLFLTALVSPASYANEHIHIAWPDNGYIFRITNATPGDTVKRTIAITGTDREHKSYFLRLRILTDVHGLSRVLHVALNQKNKTIYDGSLHELGNRINGINLERVLDKKDERLDMSVTFDRGAGNSFQKSSVSFIVEIGEQIKVHKKYETIWEKCMSYVKEVRKKYQKVSDRPR